MDPLKSWKNNRPHIILTWFYSSFLKRFFKFSFQISCSLRQQLLQQHVHRILPEAWRRLWSLRLCPKWRKGLPTRLDRRQLRSCHLQIRMPPRSRKLQSSWWMRVSLSLFVPLRNLIFETLILFSTACAYTSLTCDAARHGAAARIQLLLISDLFSHSFRIHKCTVPPPCLLLQFSVANNNKNRYKFNNK